MKFIYSLLLFLGTLSFGIAQTPYFQQEVNYRIKVELDDSLHTITGDIEMDYINNSPDELTFIYLHLWGNAFKDRNTAFARQKVRQGSSKFYFAKDKELGNYSKLNFTVDGQAAEFKLEKDNPDIAVLTLPQGLKPGEKMTIRSPFVLKIPASFSRLGHVGESYQMTQWYPKPAVYDREGWHQMPYLDMGEYYSEFGSFDVEITLPQNYIVASTGTLQTASEKFFIEKQIAASNRILQDSLPSSDDFPPSAKTKKTLRFTAEQVHDFAWFADKRFYVQKSEVTLASGKKVDTWAYFTNVEGELWKKGTFYVDRATKFYSEMVGEYPYPQATAVQSALSAGGGMEYPMITVIGLAGSAQPLDEVITHEVGHNWFYGILGFDERAHGWLDEGINSYYDHRYSGIYYEQEGMDMIPEFLKRTTDYSLLETAALYQFRRNLDQAPETDSDDFSRINYFLGIYEKPAVVLKYLEKYLGTPKYDKIMQGFYEKWKFKHPGPEDFRSYMVENSGEDLNWFFDGFINSNKKFDYALQKVKQAGDAETAGDYEVKVKNKGGIDAPFAISGVKDSKLVATQWFPGFSGSQSVTFPAGDYDRLVLDADRNAPDLYRANNSIKTQGLFKKIKPIRLSVPLGLDHSEKRTVSVLPVMSWNNYNKTMLGLAFFNNPVPAKKFEFAIAPVYSFVTKDINGTANLQYHWYAGNKFLERLTLELGVKRFNHDYNWLREIDLQYTRLMPSLKLELGKKSKSSFSHQLQFRSIIIDEEKIVTIRDSVNGNTFFAEPDRSLIHELSYAGQNKKVINPFNFRIAIEQQNFLAVGVNNQYLKASAVWNGAYTYNTGKSVDIRFFAGYFLQNNRRDLELLQDGFARGNFYLVGEGYNDYRYDDFYFGRNENQGFVSQQVMIRDGGFKNALGGLKNFGKSNDLLIAVNLKADLPQSLPFNLPLKPYLDLGYYNDTHEFSGQTLKEHFNWSGGIMLEWFNGNLAVYFPLANSKNLKFDYGEKGGYINRITYTVNLNAFNPFDIVNSISF